MFGKRIKHWFEPVGLTFLLVAFIWQCCEEHSNQMKIDGYVYELNEKLIAVWEGVYDEALHSDRYHGKAIVWVNYDALNSHIKEWEQMTDDFSTLNRQAAFFFYFRLVLYVLGSILIISAKRPKMQCES